MANSGEHNAAAGALNARLPGATPMSRLGIAGLDKGLSLPARDVLIRNIGVAPNEVWLSTVLVSRQRLAGSL